MLHPQEHCKVRIAIEDMRNKDATSAIEDHTADTNENPFLISGEKSSNDEFEDDEIVTNPKESGVMSLSPQLQNEDSLSHTPNKRRMNDERIVQYLNSMNQSLKYNQVTVQRPSLWTESLDTYIDNVLKELKDTFKSEILKIKIIVTFGNVSFDWIESHSPASKLAKSPTNSGIVKVDISGNFSRRGIGPPSPSSGDHAINDAKKSLHTDILNLIAILLDHLRVLVEDATKVKVFSLQVIEYRMTLYSLNMLNDGTFLTSELYSTLLPFSLDAISKYKGILYLMAVLHEEITKQISIMKDFDLAVHHNGKSIVRDVLKIPKGLKELLIIKK
ncbi:23033_t:CDS:2 [Rhizophagus irregularis]|nr:23033_t:CDS:2 [Rhizophagus irregularis]